MKVAFAATLLAALCLVVAGGEIAATAATRASRKAAARKEARKQRAITTRKNHGVVNQSVLKNAIPVNKDGSRRQLDPDFVITADHSIAFNECRSLTVFNEDVVDGGRMQELYEKGFIKPQKSYILFNILLTANVVYQVGGEENLYMIGIDDWMQAIAESTADKMEAELNEKENYCEACHESAELCNPGKEEQGGGDDADDADDADDGNERKLNQRNLPKGRPVNNGQKLDQDEKQSITHNPTVLSRCAGWYINCYTCHSRYCFDEHEDQQDEEEEEEYCDKDNFQNCNFDPKDVVGYLDEALCVDTGFEEEDDNGDKINIMAGPMCNTNGISVEMALFLDDECQVYDTTRSFSATMGNTYVYAVVSEAWQYVDKSLTNPIDCHQFCEYMAIEAEDEDGNQEDEEEGEAEDKDGNQDEEEGEGEVSEFCSGLLQDALDLETCNGAEADQDDGNNDKANHDFEVQDPDDEDEACLFLKNALVEEASGLNT